MLQLEHVDSRADVVLANEKNATIMQVNTAAVLQHSLCMWCNVSPQWRLFISFHAIKICSIEWWPIVLREIIHWLKQNSGLLFGHKMTYYWKWVHTTHSTRAKDANVCPHAAGGEADPRPAALPTSEAAPPAPAQPRPDAGPQEFRGAPLQRRQDSQLDGSVQN